jgi:alpha-L-fucosidase
MRQDRRFVTKIVMKRIAQLLIGMVSGLLLVVASVSILPSAAVAQGMPEKQSGKDGEQASRIDWWRKARFGMFIHWGIYSIPGQGEWVQWDKKIPVNEYAKLADRFNPVDFKADTWAELAKAAGMKYMVFTSRHHDGFAMFDDGANPFTSVNTAAKRDFVAEYVKAARQAGMGVGLYYSPLDWRYPGFFFPDLQRQSAEAMREQYHRQVEKLLSNYGKIDVLWFDGGETDWLNFGADWTGVEYGAEWKRRPAGKHYQGGFSWQHDKAYAMIRRLQPNIVINGRADMQEDFHAREGDGALGDFDNQHPWELCTTIAGAWGYQPNMQPKPLKHYIQLLAKVAGRDGNLLLNVGPAPDGRIDPAQAERLREIGAWLGKYGESIYATRGGPFLPGEYGASTHSGKTIYVHVLNWPQDKLVLPAIPAKIVDASVLAGGKAGFTQTASGIEISVRPQDRSDMDTVIALQLDSSADAIRPVQQSR